MSSMSEKNKTKQNREEKVEKETKDEKTIEILFFSSSTWESWWLHKSIKLIGSEKKIKEECI